MKTKARKFVVSWLTAWTILTGFLPTQAGTLNTNKPPAQSTIPYVPTRHDAVRDLLWLADVGTNDVVYDLGSGDGRVVIAAVRDFHARKAVGIEINPELVLESRQNAAKAGVARRVEFIQGDLFTNDFSQASVAVLYLGHGANLDLRAQLIRSLKPGARIVAHQFGMGEWPADKALDVRTALLGMYSEFGNNFASNSDVPDFRIPFIRQNHDTLSVWVVPAPVAGVWRGKVRTESGERELKLTLHQRLSGLAGSFQFQGPTNFEGYVQADLWGDHLRYHCMPNGMSYGGSLMWFDGHATNDTMSGGLWVSQGPQTRELKWTGRRDLADFTGTWEWPGSSNAPVRFKIERRDGRLAATYADQNREKNAWRDDTKPIPVFDTYDFGGGFYFTLLLGLEQSGRRAGPQDGWVVGEAVMEDGTLKGTIAFYPYSRSWMPGLDDPKQSEPPERKPAPPPGRRDWRPKRVTP